MIETWALIVIAVAQVPPSPAAAAPAAEPVYRFAIDPMTITLIGGMIVTVIGTLATAIVTIVTAIRVNATQAQGLNTADRLITVAKDTEAIKGHVNSEKTAAIGREATLQQENRLLREMLAEKAVTASLLAQASATRTARGARATDPPAGPLPVEVTNSPLVVETMDSPK